MREARRHWKSVLSVFSILSLFSSSLLFGAQDSDRAPKIYAESSKSVLLLIIKSETGEVLSQGTGFVVAGGKVVTNEHVVRSGNVVIDLGAVRLPASVERVDEFNDLALLVPSAELALKPLTISDVSPAPGTSVYAIGNPAGLEKSMSTGIVSGVRDFEGRQLLQITAPISPGSSGEPILNGKGEVVGVAVGILEKGQNLNFAVPVALVQKLLIGKVEASTDLLSLLDKVKNLIQRKSQYEYSSEPDSDWQTLNQQINTILQSALERAGTDPDLLLKIAEQAEFQNGDIAITAAERAVRAKPTAEGNLILASRLMLKTYLPQNTETEKDALLERAEKAARTALRISKQPTATTYYLLAEILKDRASFVEAESNFRRALELSKKMGDSDLQANSLRRLVGVAYSLGKQAESDTWFKALVDTGKAEAWDWEGNGDRLYEVGQFREAGQSYRQAASLGGAWTNWCNAVMAFSLAGGESDTVLFCARKCVSEGSGEHGEEIRLAYAHSQIARVLSQNGVYQEALSHAREATALDSSNPWLFDAQAEALLGLRRPREAINASNQAIRLSDGKYSEMHFRLGLAYFEVESWEFAKQSFEKASQLDLKDDVAPYNVALCLTKLGYYGDAASWYEEVLRRNPEHRNRQQILDRIQALRRQ